ncbi:hypothetical protein BVX94_02125 [bacterium B17]|nr:hypothetical protein BVX94_02125 [bacterium B17]
MYPFRITEACFRLASEETAEYVTENMLDAKSVTDSLTLLDTTLDKAPKEGLYLEFGVFSGTTINFIADKVETTVHGFDSFSGLPEDWLYTPKGHFDKGGTPPEVRDTVKLHVGWFDDTLPGFIKEHSGPVAFIHIDSDLYSSAKTILYSLKDQIQKGTVIQFDEYFNFPGWKSQEFKAFQEFINDTGLKYEYIGYTTSGFSASVVIC